MFGVHPHAGGQQEYSAPTHSLQLQPSIRHRDCATPRENSAPPPREKCTIVRSGGRIIRFNPTDSVAVKRIRQRIADDYRSRNGTRINRVAKLRIADLEWFLGHRYGAFLPDDDAGREDLVILLNHIAQNRDEPFTKMIHSARAWAPWMPRAIAEALVASILEKPRRYRATTLGRLLNLTDQEHQLGNLQTIRPVGVTDADMKEKKRIRERERKRNERHKEGAISREHWLAANPKSRVEPWKQLGISKATYYRWLKAGKISDETGPSAPLEYIYRADTPVSQEPIVIPSHRSIQAGRRKRPGAGTTNLEIVDGGVAAARRLDNKDVLARGAQ